MCNMQTQSNAVTYVWLQCTAGQSGPRSTESSPIKWVCLCGVSHTAFPVADKPKGSTPWSQCRREDRDRPKKKRIRKSWGKKRRKASHYVCQESKGKRQEEVMTHWLLKTASEKQTDIHARSQMWGEWGGGLGRKSGDKCTFTSYCSD